MLLIKANAMIKAVKEHERIRLEIVYLFVIAMSASWITVLTDEGGGVKRKSKPAKYTGKDFLSFTQRVCVCTATTNSLCTTGRAEKW